MIMAFADLGDNERVWKMFNSINPINHTSTSKGIAVYKDEPYALAGDVYAQSHPGQGGWSWYTGSAGWMYRLIIENIVGVKLVGEKLSVNPCAPMDWKSFSLLYRYKNTGYNIVILQNREGNKSISLDGKLQDDMTIVLIDDRHEHQVEVNWSVSELTTVE